MSARNCLLFRMYSYIGRQLERILTTELRDFWTLQPWFFIGHWRAKEQFIQSYICAHMYICLYKYNTYSRMCVFVMMFLLEWSCVLLVHDMKCTPVKIECCYLRICIIRSIFNWTLWHNVGAGSRFELFRKISSRTSEGPCTPSRIPLA
jgi:hypothetical protein